MGTLAASNSPRVCLPRSVRECNRTESVSRFMVDRKAQSMLRRVCYPLTFHLPAIDNCPWTVSPHLPFLGSDQTAQHDKESIAGPLVVLKRKSNLNPGTKSHPRRLVG